MNAEKLEEISLLCKSLNLIYVVRDENNENNNNINFLKDFTKSDLPQIAYGDTDSMFVLLGDYLADNNII